ncbi:MAG TPA: lipoprotein-releasing ABC transporter permease subunit [SAR86 cluster bacterium]|nr:lipoprotein-releasing ABC transporter permease subunit [SAR86 cluster bacterium]|tara:strand:- start:14402 stop:15646 length:1245 start_codon:yes stop_codon:yes gene_type:complete
MKNISLFIALRYFRSKGEGFVSFHSGMALAGIAVGVAILILVTSVMNGFEKELKTRILQAIPHASIQGNILKDNIEEIGKSLRLNKSILGIAPYIETQGLVSSGSHLKGVYIYGVDPDYEKNVSSIGNHFIEGSLNTLNQSEYNLVIGDILAIQLGLNVGDAVNILVPDTRLGIAGIFPRTKQFKVSGIFSLGAPEIDQSYIYLSISNASKLLRTGENIHGVRIRYSDLFQSKDQIRGDLLRLNKEFKKDFKASTWERNYGTLFEAIQTERFLVAFMLMTLILISSYNLMSMLIMTIKEKESQIAILMSIGAPSSIIQNIFILFGSIIGFVGILIGLIFGTLLTNYFGSIVSFVESLFGVQFMKVYFIDYFPIDIRFYWILSICIISLFLTIVSSIYPAKLASKVEPAEALKYE